MWQADHWKDYELLDASDGNRLERWGEYTLVRPDPQVIWQGTKRHSAWHTADASYSRSRSGGGAWNQNKLPDGWQIGYQDLNLQFGIKLMGFKHTGVFPEQAVNWDWFSKLIKEAGRPVSVLNLFAFPRWLMESLTSAPNSANVLSSRPATKALRACRSSAMEAASAGELSGSGR